MTNQEEKDVRLGLAETASTNGRCDDCGEMHPCRWYTTYDMKLKSGYETYREIGNTFLCLECAEKYAGRYTEDTREAY